MSTYVNSVIQGAGLATGLAIMSVILRALFHVGICG